MESLPSALVSCIALLRPLVRAEVFASFAYLIVGILIGAAQVSTDRASFYVGADDWPQRRADRFARQKLSQQACMAKLVALALASLSPADLPARLLWIADSTYTEQP